ncbi:hypothetical protein M422DRAFT_244058 [Sphaerobolus stellatus SS14]|nr:hypothetical protein M422DRAFT_244058 [Sphaerobolus stellatus SS14]
MKAPRCKCPRNVVEEDEVKAGGPAAWRSDDTGAGIAIASVISSNLCARGGTNHSCDCADAVLCPEYKSPSSRYNGLLCASLPASEPYPHTTARSEATVPAQADDVRGGGGVSLGDRVGDLATPDPSADPTPAPFPDEFNGGAEPFFCNGNGTLNFWARGCACGGRGGSTSDGSSSSSPPSGEDVAWCLDGRESPPGEAPVDGKPAAGMLTQDGKRKMANVLDQYDARICRLSRYFLTVSRELH